VGRSASRCGAHFVNRNLPTVVTFNWTEREFAQYHGRIASRLKAAVHVHISVPDERRKIARRAAW
jgi:hypothetical protein